MTEFSAEQLPIIARRILAERDAGNHVEPHRIAWANDALAFFEDGDRDAGRRVFIDDEPEAEPADDHFDDEPPVIDNLYADCAAADWWAGRTGR